VGEAMVYRTIGMTDAALGRQIAGHVVAAGRYSL
jgi:hypothetical protein